MLVYLPPGYNLDPGRRYPVLYLHDGQNLFDAATAFAGNEWGLDETAEELIAAGTIEPIIIVGIYNAGDQRITEYTHVRDRKGQGGRARTYGRYLVEELKPFIDAEYRTQRGCATTGLGGSSLGGLVTLYLGLRYPAVFGKLIVMSPSIWWARRAILRELRKMAKKTEQKIWLDTGTSEGSNPQSVVRDAQDLHDALLDKGWRSGVDLAFLVQEGAGHDEKAWGFRMRDALRFMFPADDATALVSAGNHGTSMSDSSLAY